jgi:hypothetical protein
MLIGCDQFQITSYTNCSIPYFSAKLMTQFEQKGFHICHQLELKSASLNLDYKLQILKLFSHQYRKFYNSPAENAKCHSEGKVMSEIC